MPAIRLGSIPTLGPMLHVIPSLFQPRFMSLFNVLSIHVKINATKYMTDKYPSKNEESRHWVGLHLASGLALQRDFLSPSRYLYCSTDVNR